MAAPHVEQNVQDVTRMLDALEGALKEKRKTHFSTKKTTFDVKDSRDKIQVDSWKMSEQEYKRRDLPTYARGLFTAKTRNKGSEITVRGYDKFFNTGEVHETKWDNIISRTQGPYELTLKENGCIIFVAGLEDDTLLVCSKHSTGGRADAELSHAIAGERRLEQQLRILGKTKADLARELRRRNATAVAELCDDSFEEHILAYGPEKAGLYLHGINLNLPQFATYPSNFVQDFADQWGFRKTGLMIMDDILQVKEFLEGVAESGAYEGRDVEGFVIRCRMTHDPKAAPYRDWFFKYKFEEPYLMYRQWRECTKALISGKQPRYKKHTVITEEYLLYVRQRLRNDPHLGKQYNQNHGIIALRDDFLKMKNMDGVDAANLGELEPAVMDGVTGDVILTPIATIGCGKTTVALALTHLFGWGHIQNDNITGSKRPPRFVKAILDTLQDHKAVIADRNNAQRHERKQLLTDLKLQNINAKVVCLNFQHDQGSIDEIRRITQQRVLDRGDNHQTIHAASDRNKFLGIMEGFVNRFEPCDPISLPDNGFDVVIELDPIAGSRQNLEIVVTELHRRFPKLVETMPTPGELDDAMAVSLGYRPDFKHSLPSHGNNSRKQKQAQPPAQPKKKKLEYMAVEVPSKRVETALENAFKSASKEQSRFYYQLQQTRRVQPKFHVTLMHRASAGQHPQLWERYQKTVLEAGATPENLGDCEVLLERVGHLPSAQNVIYEC